MAEKFRREKDLLGEIDVPKNVYYGIQTGRAIKNFPISGLHFPFHFIKTYAIIKKASAVANMQTKRLDRKKAHAIIRACNEIISGKLSNQFILDVYQAGAGTSTNMNLNEVVANRAIEMLGGKKGDYAVLHPNDDVNMSQSTNDTFHSAIHVSALIMLKEKLFPAIENMEKELWNKSKKFDKILKSGRTHLRYAVPITLGQEFSGYAATIEERENFLKIASSSLIYLSLGGTAVGTGLNASPKFTEMVLKEIKKETGISFKRSKNIFSMMQNTEAELQVLDSLKILAASLIKISNDIRFFSSSDVNEILLPAVQPGSSMMPGKTNPSVAEALNMVAYQIIGNDLAVTLAVQAGDQELNVMMPLVAYNLLHSIEILSNSIEVFTEKLLKGLKPNLRQISENLKKNPIVVTALTPYIGYYKAAEVVKEANQKGKSIKEIILKKKLLPEKKLDKILSRIMKIRKRGR